MRLPAMNLWVLLLLFLFGACRIDGDAIDKAFHESGANYTWIDGSNSLEIRLSGKITTNPDESDVVSLSMGGSLEIKETSEARDRQLKVFFGDDGQLSRLYSVDGVSVEFGPEARRWLGEVLPRILRETGLDVTQRIERLLEKGGTERVIEEIGDIQSNYSRRIYIQELVALSPPDPVLARRLIQEAAKIESGSELSDTLLILVPIAPDDAEVTQSLIETAGSIRSSSGRRQVLQSIVELRKLRPEAAAECAHVASDIGSSSEKSTMLVLLADSSGGEPETQLAILAAAETIRSSFEKRRAVEAVVRGGIESPEVFVAAAEAISGISSSSEKSMVLAKLAEVVPVEDVDVRGSFLKSLTSIRSISGKERVLGKLLERQDLTADARSEIRTLVEQEIPEGPVQSRLLAKASR